MNKNACKKIHSLSTSRQRKHQRGQSRGGSLKPEIGFCGAKENIENCRGRRRRIFGWAMGTVQKYSAGPDYTWWHCNRWRGEAGFEIRKVDRVQLGPTPPPKLEGGPHQPGEKDPPNFSFFLHQFNFIFGNFEKMVFGNNAI